MTTSEARNAAEAAGMQLDEPILLHSGNVSEGGDDKDTVPAEQIWDFHDLSDHFAGGVPAVQHIELVREKGGLDVPTATL